MLPNPTTGSVPSLPAGPVIPHVALLAVADAAGIVTVDDVGAVALTMGNTPIMGTAGAELTPRLPISVEPKGSPVRATPPGTVDVVVDAGVGAEDAAMLLEPDPHDPDIPDVSIPEVADTPDDAEDDVPNINAEPVVAAEDAAVPAANPPPS
jgi:hypothetical protein